MGCIALAFLSLAMIAKPTANVMAVNIRDCNPNVVDIEYEVSSNAPKVDVRILAFERGKRSLSSVVRPATFLKGSAVGDGVPANTVNKIAWDVATDNVKNPANLSIEVFAKECGEEVLKLNTARIPAHGDFGEVVCSTNMISDVEYRNALYWLYADGCNRLSLKDGCLRDSDNRRILMKDDMLQDDGYVAEFVLSTMGWQAMGTNCRLPHYVVAAIERKLQISMPYLGNHRYAIKGWKPPAQKNVRNSLYMVVNLKSNDFDFPVTYFDEAPEEWGDEFKTDKIVLRRIDHPDGIYYAGIFEITEAQWERVIGGSLISAKPQRGVSYSMIRGDAPTGDDLNSDGVANDSFVGALRILTGIATFDLPSEEEWEYAARAGATTRYLCGDSPDGIDDYSWYNVNSEGMPHEVGALKANAWGLYDVHGNVRECCLNRYSNYTYRALRGGSYFDKPSHCSFNRRSYGSPDYDFNYFGFRLICRVKN